MSKSYKQISEHGGQSKKVIGLCGDLHLAADPGFS